MTHKSMRILTSTFLKVEDKNKWFIVLKYTCLELQKIRVSEKKIKGQGVWNLGHFKEDSVLNISATLDLRYLRALSTAGCDKIFTAHRGFEC